MRATMEGCGRCGNARAFLNICCSGEPDWTEMLPFEGWGSAGGAGGFCAMVGWMQNPRGWAGLG